MDESRQPGLQIAQVFLSQAHFEHRPDALSFPPTTPVEIKYSVEAKVAVATEGNAGLITVTIKTIDEPVALYIFHVELTALVEREANAENMSVEEYLTKTGTAMMFPFLREAVANITGRGRFGAVLLKPLNVAALIPRDATEGAAAGE